MTLRKLNIILSIIFCISFLLFSNASAATLVLQPDPAAGKDAMIDEGNPTTNFGGTTALTADTPQRQEALIEFDVSSIPAGSTIISAQLELLEYANCTSNENDLDFRVNFSAWDETTVTWNNAGSIGSLLGKNTNESGGCEWLFFDVTNAVQNWVNGTPNNGLRITGPSTVSRDVVKSIYSSDTAVPANRPILRINFTPPPAAGILYLGDPIDTLYTVDTTNAGLTFIGAGECEGLAPSGDPSFLYCVNDNDTLYTIATADGIRTSVGPMGASNTTGDKGLAYNTTTGILYGVDEARFGSINTSTGTYTALATHPSESMDCLAANPNQNVIYGVDWGGSLYIYNVGTNTWDWSSLDTNLDGFDCGLAFDPTAGNLYFIESSTGNLYTININSLVAAEIGDTGITYPFGLAFLGDDLDIPTLTQWGMIIFVVLAGLGAVYFIRRQKTVKI